MLLVDGSMLKGAQGWSAHPLLHRLEAAPDYLGCPPGGRIYLAGRICLGQDRGHSAR